MAYTHVSLEQKISRLWSRLTANQNQFLNAFKANATREMREPGSWQSDRAPWIPRGNKKYLWDEEACRGRGCACALRTRRTADFIRWLVLEHGTQYRILRSTMEQEAVATWPFRDTQALVEWYRNDQVATASCSVVERKIPRCMVQTR